MPLIVPGGASNTSSNIYNLFSLLYALVVLEHKRRLGAVGKQGILSRIEHGAHQ